MATIGDRIKQLRAEQIPKLTQALLAERAGVSVDLVSKLEQGRNQTASFRSLEKLAKALDVGLADLLGRPRRLVGGSEDNPALLNLRAAITPFEPVEATESDEASTAALLESYWELCYATADFTKISLALPGLIADSMRWPNLLPNAFTLAAYVASRVGLEDLAYLGGQKAKDASTAVTDPHVVSQVDMNNIWIYLNQGRADEVLRFSVRRIDELEPNFAKADSKTLAVWGNLVTTTATAAVRASQDDLAGELLGVAQRAAAVTGETGSTWWRFGPSGVAMQVVDRGIVSEDYSKALKDAKKMPANNTLRTISRARHLEDVAVAQTKLGRDADAIITLRQMMNLAPRWVHYEPQVKSIVSDLIQRERRIKVPALRDMAKVLNIPA